MTQKPRNIMTHLRVLFSGLAVLVLLLSPAVVDATDAGWKDSDTRASKFQAGSLSISNLTCTDNSTIIGLLGSQLRLDWSPPPNSGSVDLEYTVTVTRAPILGAPETTTRVTKDTTFTYTDARLTLIALPTYTLEVKASPIGQWTGTPQRVTGEGVNVLGLGLMLYCD